jgi:hypothetical protein
MGLGNLVNKPMGSILGNAADLLDFGSRWTFVAIGGLFGLGPLLTGPIARGLPVSSVGCYSPQLGMSDVLGALGLGTARISADLDHTEVLAEADQRCHWRGGRPPGAVVRPLPRRQPRRVSVNPSHGRHQLKGRKGIQQGVR